MSPPAGQNTQSKPIAVIVGATSKWQADGRNTRLAHGKVLDASAMPAGSRFGVGGALAQKFASGALSAERAAVAPQLIFNQRLDAALTALFTAILWLVIVDMARVCVRRLRGLPLRSSSEAPYRLSQLPAAPGRTAHEPA